MPAAQCFHQKILPAGHFFPLKIFVICPIFMKPNAFVIFITGLNWLGFFKLAPFLFDWCCFYYFVRNGLVALLETLYTRIFSWIWEIGSLYLHLSWKNIQKHKKQLVQNLIPPPSIYIYLCTSYTYTDTFMLNFSPSGFLHALEMPHLDISAHIPSTQTL